MSAATAKEKKKDVRYQGFLMACAERAGLKWPAAFNKAMADDEEYKIGSVQRVTNRQEVPPGREFLEKAARLAGFELHECLDLPHARKQRAKLHAMVDRIWSSDIQSRELLMGFVKMLAKEIPEAPADRGGS